MCLALNKRPFTKERKKEEESKTIRRSGDALKKNIMKSVNSCKFKIVYKHCLIYVTCNCRRVLFITYDVDDKLMQLYTAIISSHVIKHMTFFGPVLEHSKNVGRF